MQHLLQGILMSEIDLIDEKIKSDDFFPRILVDVILRNEDIFFRRITIKQVYKLKKALDKMINKYRMNN